MLPAEHGAPALEGLDQLRARQHPARARKVGIARVVLRTREHLAAVKPSGPALLLELMHWADEVVPPSELAFPDEHQKLSPAEMKIATQLIESMAVEFDASSLTWSIW